MAEFLVKRTSSHRSYTDKSYDKEPQKPFNVELDIDGYEPEKYDYELTKKEFEWSGSKYEGWFINLPKDKILDFKQDMEHDIVITNFHDTDVKVLEIYDDYRE
jgi:hypothetical protein